ncbi:brain and acute leukemia cytoplasmic protein-like [Erpetoichthys calabaricus]|uniref:Brain and acute leukemia cytoplasmic protein n=1 Tax=Erpetoichthys calabaricus TaxID=27687 RepID=A0A8C4T7A3_ERPCA|nr:brain and acute leukemia cytoplasmic protein-like [Erpetoichthys calabaricus]
MGCGGSRADAIEPRYYESWTRETESTWLTNTDTEPQMSTLTCGANGYSENAIHSIREHGALVTGKAEGGRQNQNYVTVSSTTNNKEKKTVNTGTQCSKTPLYATSVTSTQKRMLFQSDDGSTVHQEKSQARKSITILQKTSGTATQTERLQRNMSLKNGSKVPAKN